MIVTTGTTSHGSSSDDDDDDGNGNGAGDDSSSDDDSVKKAIRDGTKRVQNMHLEAMNKINSLIDKLDNNYKLAAVVKLIESLNEDEKKIFNRALKKNNADDVVKALKKLSPVKLH